MADWIGLPFMLSEASIRSTTPLVPLPGGSTPTAATGAAVLRDEHCPGLSCCGLGSWSRYSRSGKPVSGAALSVRRLPDGECGKAERDDRRARQHEPSAGLHAGTLTP